MHFVPERGVCPINLSLFAVPIQNCETQCPITCLPYLAKEIKCQLMTPQLASWLETQQVIVVPLK